MITNREGAITMEMEENVKFCPNCHILVQGDECPVCYREELYTPIDDDFCLLTEQEVVWAGVLEDCLKTNDIPYTVENAVGAWLSSRLGPAFERKRFFVPYSRMEQAQGLVEELFQAEE